MRTEFESDLAKSVAEKGQKKVRGKAWLVMALGAALLVSGFAAVTAVSAGDQDQIKLQLKDGSCEEVPEDCDPICDEVCDQDCVEDCDPICDEVCDQDCIEDCDPICDEVCDQDCINL